MEAGNASLTLGGGTDISWALLPGTANWVGTSQSCDVKLPPAGAVAPKHCCISWDGRTATVSHFCADIVTRVNGEVIVRATTLHTGDVLAVGGFSIRFDSQTVTDPSGPPPRVAPPEPEAETEPYPISGSPFGDVRLREVRVVDGLTIGSSSECDIVIPDERVAGEHAKLVRILDGDDYIFEIVDLSGVDNGCRVNGTLVDRWPLVFGDRIELGSIPCFVYDGYALMPMTDFDGCDVTASSIEVSGRDGFKILEGASLRVQQGNFVGILGPSGAGKTTLLKALIGLVACDSGMILFGEEPLKAGTNPHVRLGYVPQFDTIQPLLTGRQALRYCSMLRLPLRTSSAEIARLITQLATSFQIDMHLDKRISSLSGGQRKRLCICVELITQPSVLFLDEPNSGLDPKSDHELFSHLKRLCVAGRTVICTTHLMNNIQLMDHLEILAASGASGAGSARNAFRGRPMEAHQFFDVGTKGLSRIFWRLEEKSVDAWANEFQHRTGTEIQLDTPARPLGGKGEAIAPRQLPRRSSLPILIERQLTMLWADRKALRWFAIQAIVLGILISLTAGGDEHVSATCLFLSYVAVMWVGCGNVATDIVGERRTFLRERFHGLSPRSYLLSKFLVWGLLASLQAIFIFSVVWGKNLGSPMCFVQLFCLLATALAGTSIGLLISCWARTEVRALILVPLFLVPQILVSGYVVPIKEWDRSFVPRYLSRAMPSFACQRIMDSSFLWGVPVEDIDVWDDSRQGQAQVAAVENMETAVRPWFSIVLPKKPVESYSVNESLIFRNRHSSQPGWEPPKNRELHWDGDEVKARLGDLMVPYFETEFVEQLEIHEGKAHKEGKMELIEGSFEFAMITPILRGGLSLLLWIFLPLMAGVRLLTREPER